MGVLGLSCDGLLSSPPLRCFCGTLLQCFVMSPLPSPSVGSLEYSEEHAVCAGSLEDLDTVDNFPVFPPQVFRPERVTWPLPERSSQTLLDASFREVRIVQPRGGLTTPACMEVVTLNLSATSLGW